MNPEQPITSGLPLPQTPAPVGGVTPGGNLIGGAAIPHPVQQVPLSPYAAPAMGVPAAASVPESDESDENDEAWVAKAREIVERTRDDPYMQSKALTRLRVDYMKTKYHKDIKISEDAT